MRMFDVHELEDRITEVLQSVQETGETVAVTKGVAHEQGHCKLGDHPSPNNIALIADHDILMISKGKRAERDDLWTREHHDRTLKEAFHEVAQIPDDEQRHIVEMIEGYRLESVALGPI